MKPETLTKAKIFGRGVATGVGLTTAVIFGPDTARDIKAYYVVSGQNGALGEGRQNLSHVSTHDLTHTGEKTEKKDGGSFNSGGTPPNVPDAIGRTDYAAGRFLASTAPREVVDHRINNIKALIQAEKPGHKEAKDAIIELDGALKPHHSYLRQQMRDKQKEAFANAAKVAVPGAAWAGVEGAVLYKRRKKGKAQSPTQSVSTRKPSTMLELPRSTPSR